MAGGYISISRSILDWRWSDNPIMMYFWIRILLMANWEDKEWHDIVIERGSFVTTIAGLADRIDLTVKQVRTCLSRLRAGGEVALKATNSYTIVTICKYDDYQSLRANEGQTKDKRTASTKEIKKEKKEEDTNVSSKKERVDYGFIMDMWNTSMTRKIAKIQKISDSRQEKIRLRVAEMGGWEAAKKTLAACFAKMNESDFCNGQNNRNWKPDFDWFFDNDKNWLKVSEGKYNKTGDEPKSEKLLSSKEIFKMMGK